MGEQQLHAREWETFLVILLFIAFAAIVFALMAWSHHLAKKRQEELAAWAKSYGFSFSPAHDDSMDSRFPQFSCLQEGSDRYAYNVIRGGYSGRAFCAFDYHYETYSTDSKGRRTTHNHYFSAAIMDSVLPLKPLYIRPEGFLDKVFEFLGADDIDFESAEFSRTFHVKADKKRWAFDVIHQETMEFLLKSPHFTIEFQGQRVIAYRGNTFAVGDFEAAIYVLDGLLDRLPESVARELKEGA
jgi:hypothetical protein